MPLSAQYKTFSTLKPEEKNNIPPCIECQDLDHRKKMLDDHEIICIDLYATWCQPCKEIAPKFAELAQLYNTPGRCLLFKENVDHGLTRDYNITGIPAFIFYRRGQLVRKQDGSPLDVIGGDINKVRNILDKLLGRG